MARLMLHSSAEAEDIVQDSLIKLWRHLPELEAGGELGWLITCTRNACLDQLRGRNRQYGFLQLVAGDTNEVVNQQTFSASEPASGKARERRHSGPMSSERNAAGGRL